MELKRRSEEGYDVMELAGEIDLHYAPSVRKEILGVLERSRDLLVDLSGVETIDSSGIATLVEAFQLAKSKQIRFGLVSISEAVSDVLTLTRLTNVFPIFDDLESFVAAEPSH
jgi:anti-sigma B factor antagonist